MTLTLFGACNYSPRKCEVVQEWKVGNYKITKSKCPDLVLSNYYTYDIYIDDQRKGNVKQIDSCIFTWQADRDRYLTLNVCNNSINEIKPQKILLRLDSIDSITIYSSEHKKAKRLTTKQIETFVSDWNNSVVRNYIDIPLDSAFSTFPAYQYRLTVYEKVTERNFYGYNYLILDDHNWQYEMVKDKNLDYFHQYWI